MFRLFGSFIIGICGYFILLPKVLQWGVSDEERTTTMLGDGWVLPRTRNSTQAITIHAEPEDIWDILIQFGTVSRAHRKIIKPKRVLLLLWDSCPDGSFYNESWSVIISPIDGGCRVVARSQTHLLPTIVGATVFYFERPVGLIMERRLLHQLKRCAESRQRALS